MVTVWKDQNPPHATITKRHAFASEKTPPSSGGAPRGRRAVPVIVGDDGSVTIGFGGT